MKDYFNTTGESGQQLLDFTSKASTQKEMIFAYLEKQGGEHSPSQVWKGLFNCSIPLTSVRARMTVLTKEGKLVQTSNKISGFYGRPEYTWRVTS